ncbi:carbohydrate ABC transporter membrane protein 2, CUT1 family [Rhizobiales bacterium GAS191]|jgi:ABC-type glycerol-3-phosphate transport system permease component|nr:carbohydrate ABC transporter membrane protein 2, CUT1 family [Rhizobiales bacterium GAS113]SED67005.1 carbohydrate ABC transporter membrane protein 2, CUT1 family [Rhizobiales bacterium GAS188]SEE84115.1 carbohydrate ABC transporter membrane protein 2, CUT1 family [Rhizobiales bacterium GAS191]
MPLSPPWRAFAHLALVILSIVVLVPMLVVLGAAFKPEAEMFELAPWPSHPTLDNFRTILIETPFLTYLGNSAGTTALRVGGQLIIATLAAYGFARWSFPGRDLCFAVVLGAMMIPHQLTVIPTYMLISKLGWLDSWTGLIVPNLATPFGAFLLRQHFLSFPPALYEAAELDGAGHLRTLWHIVIPMMAPALSALAIVLFIECWNEYFWPLLVAPSPDSRTLQVGLRAFLEEQYSNYGALMAGVTLASLPALAVFLALHRRVIQAFVNSGLTG